MSDYWYECPNCGSHDLLVTVTTKAALIQNPEEDSFETSDVGTHEWDNRSRMECNVCFHNDRAEKFRNPFRMKEYDELVENAMFKMVPTGGGCTALCAQTGPVYWMITDNDGGNYAPEDDEEPVIIGKYSLRTGDCLSEREFSTMQDCMNWFRHHAANEIRGIS